MTHKVDVLLNPNTITRRKLNIICDSIGLDKSGYQFNIFLISPRKHVLWVLIRSASARRFKRVPIIYVFVENKNNINTFGLKKAP